MRHREGSGFPDYDEWQGRQRNERSFGRDERERWPADEPDSYYSRRRNEREYFEHAPRKNDSRYYDDRGADEREFRGRNPRDGGFFGDDRGTDYYSRGGGSGRGWQDRDESYDYPGRTNPGNPRMRSHHDDYYDQYEEDRSRYRNRHRSENFYGSNNGNENYGGGYESRNGYQSRNGNQRNSFGSRHAGGRYNDYRASDYFWD